jgi:hypothetical protein
LFAIEDDSEDGVLSDGGDSGKDDEIEIQIHDYPSSVEEGERKRKKEVELEVSKQRKKRRSSSSKSSLSSQNLIADGLKAMADGMVESAKIEAGKSQRINDEVLEKMVEEQKRMRLFMEKQAEEARNQAQQSTMVNSALLEFLKKNDK